MVGKCEREMLFASGAVLPAGRERAAGDCVRGKEGAPHLLQDQDGQGQVAKQG
jgi:hypothetical protein